MKLIGLTGGIGMGKSAAAGFLAKYGCNVIDTDVLARELVEPGQPALREIREFFGKGVIAADGTLRRGELARLVFGDEPRRRRLEEILHPRIREAWKKQASKLEEAGSSKCVVVIPLLFETKAESEFDAIVCVACSAETQFRRLKGRGWSEAEIAGRLRAQWPIEQKVKLSNYVVWAEGSLEVHEEQVRRIVSRIDELKPRA